MSGVSVTNQIQHYQKSIEKNTNNEKRLLHCIEKLYMLPVTVQHLQQTGVGRTINALRKYKGTVGDASKALVAKWKTMVVDEESSEGDNDELCVPYASGGYSDHSDSSVDGNFQDPTIRCKSQESRHRNNEVSHNKYDSKHTNSHSHHKESSSDSSKPKSSSVKNEDKEVVINNSDKYISKKSDDNSSATSSDKSRTMKKKHSSKSSSDSGVCLDEDKNNAYKSRKRKASSDEKSSSSSSSKDRRNSINDEVKAKKSVPDVSMQLDEDHNNDGSHASSSSSSSKSLNNEKRKDKSKDKSSKESRREKSDRSDGSSHKSSSKSGSKSHKHKRDENSETGSSDKSKRSSEHRHKSSKSDKKDKIKLNDQQGIDCNSGTSFADALGMCTGPSYSKKKNLPSPSKIEKSSSKETVVQSKPSKPIKIESPSAVKDQAPSLLSPNVQLEPLKVDLTLTLPEITPNYKPLPPIPVNSIHRKQDDEREILSEAIYAKNVRTKVYSGIKASYTSVPSLYDLCIRILIENIEALEFTGGVPYYIIKPVLERATADQLFMIEHYNPYLIEDTDELWKFHCNREFRNKQREEMECWREMYMRCLDEREAKLKTLTANIKQSIDKSLPVRSTIMAYVDDVVKPPRNILRKQAKYGTATDKVPSSSGLKKKIIAGTHATNVAVPPPPSVKSKQSSSGIVKKNKAPLMAKALQLIKGRYKR